MNNSSLATYKQNLVTRKLPFVKVFNHEGTVVIDAMRDQTVGVFGHLDITSKLDLDIGITYTERILRGSSLKTI